MTSRRPGRLAAASSFLAVLLPLSAVATAQKEVTIPESAASGFDPGDGKLRHIEGTALAFPLPLLAHGPLGSLIRSRTVTGTFATNAAITESFEGGTLDASWTTSSSTPNGRIQITGDFGAADGDLALLMDTTVSGPNNLNEAILTVDMTKAPSAVLVFSTAEWNDEQSPFLGDFNGSFAADGVAISDDGVRWHPVLSAPNTAFGVWVQHRIDLAAAAAAAGMQLGPAFKIKFQQFDNFPLTTDGRGYDGIGFEIPGLDADTFEMTLDPGQKLEVRLSPPVAVAGYVKVEEGGRLVAEQYGSGPGEPVILRAVDTHGLLSGKGAAPRTYRITVVNANGALGTYSLFVALNETSEAEPVGGSSNDAVAGAEDLGPSFVPLLTSVKASGNGLLPLRAAVHGTGGRKASALREDFESGALGGAWTTSSSTPTGRIRVTGDAGTAAGAFALVMDNDVEPGTSASFYEQFFSGASNDLSGKAIQMTPNASGGYDVSASAATYVTPSTNLFMSDDAIRTRNLGFTIPWPGFGSVSSITIASNGRIGPAGRISGDFTQSVFEFLRDPEICPLWDDLNPSARGAVYFDVTATRAIVSWDAVPQFPAFGANTFQIQIESTGVIHIVWVHVEANAIVGFSDGRANTGEVVAPSARDLSILPFSTSSSTGGATTFNLNEAIWTVDLSGVPDPSLRFRYRRFSDEFHFTPLTFTGSANGDGVSISDDGITWRRVLIPNIVFAWATVELSLTSLAASAGMTLGPNFRIKFQQYDNAAFPLDGIGYDEIEIRTPDVDYYKVSLVAGESIALYGTGSGLDIDLLDPDLVPVGSVARQPVVNGSFESGFFGWQATTFGRPVLGWITAFNGFNPGFGLRPSESQDGFRVMANGFATRSFFSPPPPHSFTLSQVLDVPTKLTGPLSWVDRVQWDFTAFGNVATQPRTYRVEIRDPGTDAVLQTLSNFSTGTQAVAPSGNTGWRRHEADLSPWAGQQVKLVFHEDIPEPDTGAGFLEIDAVQVDGIPNNVNAFAPVFVAPRTGDYYVRVHSATTAPYDVLVMRNAEFGFEPNDSVLTGQPLNSVRAGGRRWVVGHSSGLTQEPDYYRIRGTQGHTLVAETYTPGGGAGELTNNLDPDLRLFDSAGNQLALDADSAPDGRNARLEYEFGATGDYFVAVSSKTTVYASEDFESGTLGPQWSTSSSTADGRITITDAFGATSGSKALVLDKATNDGQFNLNTATLTVDMTGAVNPLLTLAHRSLGDEFNVEDGLFVSDDGGATWVQISSLFSFSSAFQTFSFNLGNRGLTFGPNFKVRLQQFDNFSAPTDGRVFDSITITETAPAGEYVLSTKGDN